MKIFLIVLLLALPFSSQSTVTRTYVGECEESREVSRQWYFFVKLADLRLSIVAGGSHESLTKIDEIITPILGFFANLDCIDPDMVEGFMYFEEHLQINPPTSAEKEIKEYFEKIRSLEGT